MNRNFLTPKRETFLKNEFLFSCDSESPCLCGFQGRSNIQPFQIYAMRWKYIIWLEEKTWWWIKKIVYQWLRLVPISTSGPEEQINGNDTRMWKLVSTLLKGPCWCRRCLDRSFLTVLELLTAIFMRSPNPIRNILNPFNPTVKVKLSACLTNYHAMKTYEG